MAQAENASFGTWLHHSYKCKFSSFLFSFLLPTTLLLLAHFCHGSKDDHFYLDLPSREAFACPEVSSFVNEFDPFYRWSMRSSLPSVLSTTAEIDIELANYVYQQASAWRVISDWPGDGNGTKKLYASAEPHIAGGHMNHNWLWKMRVDWGISARMCIFDVGVENSNRSCLWTTPIISMENEPDLLSQLLVGLPYRVPAEPGITPDLDNMKRSTTGYYLTNYASNARTDFTKYQKLNTSSSYYLTSTKQLKKCVFAPSYYNNDAMAYLAFSALQCGCSNSSTKVCVVVTKKMDTSSWGLFDYRSSCDSLKSYWAWNTGGDWLVLDAHNTPSDKAVPFHATFPGVNGSLAGPLLTSITVEHLRAMEKTTACVEALMQQTPVPSEVEVVNNCSNNQLQLTTEKAGYYLNLMRRYIWTPEPPNDHISSSCSDGLRRGQLEFQDKLCVTNLDPAISKEIKQTIDSMLQLRDVKFKQNKLWEDGSNSRHQAYTGILSAIVSFVGTCFLVTSDKVQDLEESANRYIQKVRKCFAADSNSSHTNGHCQLLDLTWFFCRIILVAGSGGLLIYTAYSSLESVKKDRDMLQAQTVPQVLSDGTMVLLTITATYEVKIVWTLVYVVSVITGVVAIGTLVYAWKKLNKDKNSKPWLITATSEDNLRQNKNFVNIGM